MLAPARAQAAEPAVAPPHRHALSLAPIAFFHHGVQVQYEGFVAPPRVSVVTKLGYRRGASGDYDATTLQTGLEARVWITGRAPGVRGRDMAGPFGYVRLDTSFTGASRDGGRSLGSVVTIAEGAGVGFRFVLGDRFELTPSLGLGVATDLDGRGRLPPWTRLVLAGGFTVGVLFR